MPVRPTTVLLVEDETATAELVRSALELEGYVVQCAESGQDGLELAVRLLPDVIITDYMMPNMGGLSMVSELRKQPATAGIPILMASAIPLDADIDADIGADAYLVKPFALEELFQAVKGLVARS